MSIITATTGSQTTEHEIGDQPLALIVHQPGIRVAVPDATTITSRDTLDCMRSMSQQAWENISTGGIFKAMWDSVLKDYPDVTIPKTIDELNSGDIGVCHMAGLFVLGIEAVINGSKRVYYEYPETFMHPGMTRCLVGAFQILMAFGNPDNTQPQTHQENVSQCLDWIERCGRGKQDRVFVEVNGIQHTYKSCLWEVATDTAVGQQLVQMYVNWRDGKGRPPKKE